MPPTAHINDFSRRDTWSYGLSARGQTLEAWSLGWLFCGLVIMSGMTVANMGRRLLHRLILIELVLAMLRPTVVFMEFDEWGWYHSSVSTLLYCSYLMHDVISWLKVKPFLSQRASYIYIGSLMCVIPYWILETYANFTYFNGYPSPFPTTRILEAVFRDPWWIFACCNLVYNIKKRYNFGLFKLIRTAPRFGVMLVAMGLSIVFLVVDVVVAAKPLDGATGINPFWKFSMVFKCFSDTIILDDFKCALDKLRMSALGHSKMPYGQSGDRYRPPEVINLGLVSKPGIAAVKIERCGPEVPIEAQLDPDTIYVSKTIALEETSGRFESKVSHDGPSVSREELV